MVSSSRPASSVTASKQTACTIMPTAGEAGSRRLALFGDEAASPAASSLANVDPTRQSPAAPPRRRSRHSFAAPAAPSDTQPQRIMIIEHSLQRRNQLILAQFAGTCRIAWSNRSHRPAHLLKPGAPPASLGMPHGDVRQRGRSLLRASVATPASAATRLMLEHRTCRDDEPRPCAHGSTIGIDTTPSLTRARK